MNTFVILIVILFNVYTIDSFDLPTEIRIGMCVFLSTKSDLD